MLWNGVCVVPDCCLAERYIWCDLEISHSDVLVCDGDQKQEAGPSFSKYGKPQVV